MKIVGHRGAEGYAPENTLPSFQQAIEIGCDRTELDVRLSQDGEVIVMHDAEVDRTCDGSGRVEDLTVHELKQLNCADGEKIPTLQEVIDLCRDKIDLQIELKANGTPKKVHELMTKNNVLSQVIVSSFDEALIREIKEINPLVQVLLLFRNFDEKIWDIAKSIPLEYIGLRSTLVTSEIVNKAHSLKIKVYAYHVHDLETGEQLKKMGVDDIGTPWPKLFVG